MLKLPSLSQTRRVAGVAVALAVVVSSSLAVWASQPAPRGGGGAVDGPGAAAGESPGADVAAVRLCPITGKPMPMVKARSFEVI